MSSGYALYILNDDIEMALENFFFSENPFEGEELLSNEGRVCAAQLLIDTLLKMSFEDIEFFIESRKEKILEFSAINVPQYSNLDSVDEILDYVEVNPGATFDLLGYYFNKEALVGAQRKYGENHYKTAGLLGLTTMTGEHALTTVGTLYKQMDDDTRHELKAKLCFRVPIVQYLIINSIYNKVYAFDVICNVSGLPFSTSQRRRSNVKRMVMLISENMQNHSLISENLDWNYTSKGRNV